MEAKSNPKGKQSVTEIEKNLNNIFTKMKTNEKDLKEELEGIRIENASEVHMQDGNHCYLIQISSASDKAMKKVHSFLVTKFEEHLSTPVVIIPSKKRINGNLYRQYRGTKVPRDRTLTAIFDSYLEDLLYPATMIGKRMRFPKGKVKQYKAIVDSLDKETIIYKVPAITSCYKALTNRDLQVEFPELNK